MGTLAIGLAMWMAAQQTKTITCSGSTDGKCIPTSPITITTTGTISNPGIQTNEIISKDGHYRWSLDDPSNTYRCQVVSVVDPHNIFRDAPAFMVACFLQHEVEKEK